LCDLTFLEDGNITYLNVNGTNGIVNCHKTLTYSETVMNFMKYLQVGYNFTKVDVIYDFISNNLSFIYENENEQYKRSLELEPREFSSRK